MGLALNSAPATEPVTLTEAKAHVRQDLAVDDTLITSLIIAARVNAEDITGRAFVTQTWDYTLDRFPANGRIRLPLPPLVSVTHVKYIDGDGALQTLDSGEYKVLTDETPGEVVLAYNKSWPDTRAEAEAVTIRYVAGYGAASAVPQTIKQAILLMIGHWYTNRETVGAALSEVPLAARYLLESSPNRVMRF